jgi:hypothetical protein
MFKLEINSLEEFIKFIRFIRSEDMDEAKIKELTKELNMSTDKLIDAEKKQA